MNRGSKLYLRSGDTCVAMLKPCPGGTTRDRSQKKYRVRRQRSRKEASSYLGGKAGIKGGGKKAQGESLRGVWGGMMAWGGAGRPRQGGCRVPL